MHIYNCASAYILAAVITLPISGEENNRLFSGGMAVQAGYASLKNDVAFFDGLMAGLGGRLQFYLGEHFRLGGGGAAVKMSYTYDGYKDNYTRISYGGLTAELTTRVKMWQLSAGLLGGGGSFTNLHTVSENTEGRLTVILEKQGTLILSPIITIERDLTESIALMLMADYLWGPKLGKKQHLSTPKVHVGVLFNK